MDQQPRISRRAFAQFSAVGLAGLVGAKNVGEFLGGSPTTPTPGLRLDQLTCATFAAFVGANFRLRSSEGRTLEAQLTEANEIPSNRPNQARQPFSLTFRSPVTTSVAQGTYRISHERLGNLEIFLVPIGPNSSGVRLEAIFS